MLAAQRVAKVREWRLGFHSRMKPSRWDEAVGALCLWIFSGCPSSCCHCWVLGAAVTQAQGRGMMMMLLRRQSSAIYKQLCWQLPRLGRKTAQKKDLRMFGRKVLSLVNLLQEISGCHTAAGEQAAQPWAAWLQELQEAGNACGNPRQPHASS